MLLALTASVWSSAVVAVDDRCRQEARVSVASDKHDCCRAQFGEANSDHSESPNNSTGATCEKFLSQNQVAGSQTGIDCEGAAEKSVPKAKATAFGECELSCFECCANRSGQMPPLTIVTSEPNTLKRTANIASVSAWYLRASTALDVSSFALLQHSPPLTAEGRRHMLISVFLI
jgi:hypothetical protein